jgi:hypothetical protein
MGGGGQALERRLAVPLLVIASRPNPLCWMSMAKADGKSATNEKVTVSFPERHGSVTSVGRYLSLSLCSGSRHDSFAPVAWALAIPAWAVLDGMLGPSHHVGNFGKSTILMRVHCVVPNNEDLRRDAHTGSVSRARRCIRMTALKVREPGGIGRLGSELAQCG